MTSIELISVTENIETPIVEQSTSNNILSWLLIIGLAIFSIWILYKVIKHKLKNKIEVITAYTGGLGSGKTFFSVNRALSLYGKNYRKWKRARKWHLFKCKFNKKLGAFKYEDEPPRLYSSIPIRIGYEKIKVPGKFFKKRVPYFSWELTKEHLLLQERLNYGSVVLIDEIGSFASQFDYNQKNVIEVFDEFVRFFRHYVSNVDLKIQSYMVVNDQCSENINLVIRRRLNIINNLSNFYLILGFMCFWFERKICISEEIKTIDVKQAETEADTQDNSNFKFCFYFGGKHYDSYCYHGRYLKLPKTYDKLYLDLKKNDLLKCPRDKEMLYTQKTN